MGDGMVVVGGGGGMVPPVVVIVGVVVVVLGGRKLATPVRVVAKRRCFSVSCRRRQGLLGLPVSVVVLLWLLLSL